MNSVLAYPQSLPSAPIVHRPTTDWPAGVLTREQMNRALDELSFRFVVASRMARAPVLDFGCGEGLAAAAALTRGAHVYAIDPDEGAIRRLLAGVPSQQHCRLRTRVASLLGTGFKGVYFDAIHAARVLQDFDGVGVESVLKKFHRWLHPNGRLFISALTPIGAFWNPFTREYQRRCELGERWPGYIEDVAQFAGHEGDTRAIHLLDEATLRHELEAAGFAIDEIRCAPLAWDNTQISCAAIARRRP